MKSEPIGVLILGCGVAGQVAAYRANKAGKSVAIVESGPPGGTCPNRGCDAKKPLVNAVSRLRQFQAMQGHGLAGEARIDWPALIKFKRSFTEPIPDRTREDLRDAGIKLIEASARFVDPHTVEAGGTLRQAEQIVIATGQRPRTLELPEGGAEHTITSDGFLELDNLPARIVFIGGGYVSMEFASVASAAGAKVTVLEAGTYPLSPFDPDLVRELLAAMNGYGVNVLTRRTVIGIDKQGGSFHIKCENEKHPIQADLVVNATGRVPSIDGMDLDKVGIAHGKRGIEVDDTLRSVSHDHIWSAGDVADNGRAPLTPTASEDGRVVAHNLLKPDKRQKITTPIASVCFTYPPIASAGLSEDQARERFGDSIEVVSGSMAKWKHFRQQREDRAQYKMIFDSGQRLVGAHLLGADCEEVINNLALAINYGCDKTRLCDTTMSYPSVAFSLNSVLVKQLG